MTRKIWVDRKGNKIEHGTTLKHVLDGHYIKVEFNRGQLGFVSNGGVIPLVNLFHDDAYSSIDLKKNEFRLRDFEVVNYD